MAEESVELRKENETLALLRQRRKQQQENLDLKKLIHRSLIQNMNDSPQVKFIVLTMRLLLNFFIYPSRCRFCTNPGLLALTMIDEVFFLSLECSFLRTYFLLLSKYVRALRFREVCSVFKMMSIIPDIPPRATSKAKNEKNEILRGVSTIMGLPLLNSGSYEGIPVEVVSSALSLAAHLVDTVASILNIHLDHPLRPFETFECVISPNFDHRSVTLVMSHLLSFIKRNLRLTSSFFEKALTQSSFPLQFVVASHPSNRCQFQHNTTFIRSFRG